MVQISFPAFLPSILLCDWVSVVPTVGDPNPLEISVSRLRDNQFSFPLEGPKMYKILLRNVFMKSISPDYAFTIKSNVNAIYNKTKYLRLRRLKVRSESYEKERRET